MILWTIQPEEVYRLLTDEGVYRCNPEKSYMYQYWPRQYDWLISQMKNRIGPPPEGVFIPVWAWYMWEGQRKKPDLRRERWENGWKGERFVSLEIDIPEDRVLLSDFDAWSVILHNGFLSMAEEENDELKARYESLAPDEQEKMQSKNWEGMFDLTSFSNGWITRGESIQATFWELRMEQVKKVRTFVSAAVKPPYIDENDDIIEEKLPKRKNKR